MSGPYVLRRELRALVASPQTYAIAAAYLVLSGIFFVNILITSQIPDLEHYYANVANTLLVLVPVVAMRSFAEERRTGALDITLSWRLSRTGLVLGKFVANTLYLWVLSSIVWLYYHLVGNLTHIQMGRTAGGFIGLALMALAFSALALMISARATSPAAAAFLGFGLLLFLRVLDYAPGWIGDRLASLGPTQHSAGFARGVVYWNDVAYFAIVTLIGLGLAVAALERDRPGRRLGTLLRRGAAVGGVLVLCGGTVALAGDFEGSVDLTPEHSQSITAVTHDVIARVNRVGRPVHLTGFAAPITNDAEQLTALVKQYRSAGLSIDLEVIDPDLQPGRARAAHIDSQGEAVVEMGGRTERLNQITQGALTSALLRLSRDSRPRACFTAGHGERDPHDEGPTGASKLSGAVQSLAFDVKTIGLAAPGAESELARCAVVVVAGPRIPFLPIELQLLGAHAEQNGRLLVMADGTADAPRVQLNTVLAPWGLTIGTGIVTDASALANDPTSVVALDYASGSSPPVRRLNEESVPVVFTNAVPLLSSPDARDRNAIVELVRSSRRSWAGSGPGRQDGPFVLAALADWSHLGGSDHDPEIARTRIGVMGTAEPVTNSLFDMFGNRDFATALVQWTAAEDDLLAAGRPVGGFSKVVLTAAQKDRLIKQGIVYPAFLVLLPLPWAVWRLRRG
ncbi:MAG TPA: Gldg family protein [Acidimicrobiia bacterium]|nr:Gldg family protein [Acidimicrobiia bacterium]